MDYESMAARERAVPDELRRRALDDAVLRVAVELFIRGDLTLEAAMTRAALHLAEACERYRAEWLSQLNRCTCHVRFVVPVDRDGER